MTGSDPAGYLDLAMAGSNLIAQLRQSHPDPGDCTQQRTDTDSVLRVVRHLLCVEAERGMRFSYEAG